MDLAARQCLTRKKTIKHRRPPQGRVNRKANASSFFVEPR